MPSPLAPVGKSHGSLRMRQAALGIGLLLASGGAWALWPRRDDIPLDPAVQLAAEATTLRARLELAAADRRYLVLEPQRGVLTLVQGGAELRSWPVRDVSAGARHLTLGADPHREDWRRVTWTDGRLDPPVRRERRVVVSNQVEPPDLTGAVEWVPPTPEEEIPAPGRFWIHFEEGLGLEVQADASGDAPARPLPGPGLMASLRAAVGHLSPRNWDRYRVRVVMEPADAGSLYRTLPDSVAFVATLPER